VISSERRPIPTSRFNILGCRFLRPSPFSQFYFASLRMAQMDFRLCAASQAQPAASAFSLIISLSKGISPLRPESSSTCSFGWPHSSGSCRPFHLHGRCNRERHSKNRPGRQNCWRVIWTRTGQGPAFRPARNCGGQRQFHFYGGSAALARAKV